MCVFLSCRDEWKRLFHAEQNRKRKARRIYHRAHLKRITATWKSISWSRWTSSKEQENSVFWVASLFRRSIPRFAFLISCKINDNFLEMSPVHRSIAITLSIRIICTAEACVCSGIIGFVTETVVSRHPEAYADLFEAARDQNPDSIRDQWNGTTSMCF